MIDSIQPRPTIPAQHHYLHGFLVHDHLQHRPLLPPLPHNHIPTNNPLVIGGRAPPAAALADKAIDAGECPQRCKEGR